MNSKIDIQRIIVKAKPSQENKEYLEWQTASIVFFIPENNKQEAVEKARQELTRRNWNFLSYESKSTLIESRVKEEGGEVWQAFQEASTGKIFIKVFPDHFGAGDDDSKSILPMRISEEFMDQVFNDAGGRRLEEKEISPEAKNADYLIGQFVFELKDIQEEGLEKDTHQKKLAELLLPYHPNQSTIWINPSILSEQDYLKYLDIISRPIKTHIQKASKQIKATKTSLGREDLRGGLILLNTGFCTFPDEIFAEQVERYAKKDSRQFAAIVSISIETHTNGFNSYVFYRFSPFKPQQKEVISLREAFDKRFEKMMTDTILGNLPQSAERATPFKPVAFNYGGIDFTWMPPEVPLPWKKTGSNH